MNLSYKQRKGGAKGAEGSMEVLLHLLHPRHFRHTEKSRRMERGLVRAASPGLRCSLSDLPAQVNDLQTARKFYGTRDKEDTG